jgi:hypothetical protein
MVIKSVDVHFDRHETKKVYLLKKKLWKYVTKDSYFLNHSLKSHSLVAVLGQFLIEHQEMGSLFFSKKKRCGHVDHPHEI